MSAGLTEAFNMLREGAQDAVLAFKLLRVGMADNPAATDVIDAHIDELEFALDAARGLPVMHTDGSGVGG